MMSAKLQLGERLFAGAGLILGPIGMILAAYAIARNDFDLLKVASLVVVAGAIGFLIATVLLFINRSQAW
jgi:hypothetical protein